MDQKMKTAALVIILSLCNALWAPIQAQDEFEADSTSETQISKKKLIPIIATQAVIYSGGLYYLGNVWYKHVPRVPFHLYHDLHGYKQIDKFGHAYGAYIESYIAYKSLRAAGVSKKHALIYGGPVGLVMQTPIEIFDGIYKGWGFSISDMVANALGSAFLVGQEILFDEQLIRFKFSFWPSPYSQMAYGYLGSSFSERLFYDYNGHTYWFSTSANKLIFKQKLPPWICFSLGYSAGGMFGEFENIRFFRGREIPDTERYRQFLFSLDIDWSKIPTKNRHLKKLLNGMFMIKTPFPALEINTKGKIKGHFFYF
jgi:hypothetical protein